MNDKITTTLNAVKEATDRVDWYGIEYELERMDKLKAWCLENVVPFKVGETVAMNGTLTLDDKPGWKAHEHTLTEGNRAVIQDITFNPKGYWVAEIRFLIAYYKDYANGSVKQSSDTDLVFYMPIQYLRKDFA